MDRREALGRLGRLASVGALAGLAGCGSVGSNSPPPTTAGTEPTVDSPTATESSDGTDAGGTTGTDTSTGDGGGTGTPTPEPVFTIEDVSATETETGDLKVTVTAKNVSDELATRLIVVEVTVGSGSSATTYKQSEDLALGPGDTGSFNVVFDVSYQEFEQEGGVRVDIY